MYYMRRLVILGGGYGGQMAIQKLLDGNNIPEDVVLMLIDRLPLQGLKTEYYALAAGTVSDISIRVNYPIDPRLIIKHGEVTGVSFEEQLIFMEEDDPISYDWLILGLGCVDSYHGIPGANQHTFSLQTLAQARQTYQAVNNVKPYGQISIVGGGLSGVEIAAELRESRSDLNIRILDRGSSILSPFPDKLKNYVSTWFSDHQVEMIPHADIRRVDPGMLHDREKEVLTDVIVWTAGIQPSPIVQQLNVPKDSQGRILLNAYHQIPEYPNVYVVGDCASLPFAPSAQAAEAQGEQIARVLLTYWQGKTVKLPRIKLKGVLGSLGKSHGFGVLGERTLIGRIPRVLKTGVLWMYKKHLG
jgi:NADH dehydrogenase